MKNKINVRIEGLSNNNFMAMLDHNLRKDTTRNQSKNDNNIIIKFDNDNNNFQIFETQLLDKNTQNNLSENELNNYKNKRHNMLNYRQELLKKYENDREEHKQFYKKRTRTQLKDDVASWGNGIITFSEKIQNDYNNGTLDLEKFYKCAFNSVNEICAKLNATPELCVIHFDETCPHIHLMFKNYDENGKSLSNNFNLKQRQKKEKLDKPILESLQDIGAANFAPFDVERGDSKLLTNHRHKTTQQYHLETIKTQEDLIRQNDLKILEQQKQQKELKDINNEIAEKKAQLEQKRKEEEAYLNVNDYSKFNFSETTKRIKQAYQDAEKFIGFDDNKFDVKMLEILGELLELPTKLRNIQDKIEIKNKQLANFANERENLIKLSSDIDKKDLEISKQNLEIKKLEQQLTNFINTNIDLQTKKDNLELVVENLIKKFAPGEVKEIYSNIDNSDIFTLNIENNSRTLSSEELSLSIDSLDIDNNLKQAITNHIKKHK